MAKVALGVMPVELKVLLLFVSLELEPYACESARRRQKTRILSLGSIIFHDVY